MANQQPTNPAFQGKLFITGTIIVQTGLHIGGAKTSLDIGGIDLGVIKSAKGNLPFIPGSSLKGKMRSLLARTKGSQSVDKYPGWIKRIFGFSADDESDTFHVTRLIVRDAFLDSDHFESVLSQHIEVESLETEYTEGKWENTIDRAKGSAGHPRQLERVPPGAQFNFELVYDVYDDNREQEDMEKIMKALRLLQDDYLGGHGTCGYGKIAFGDIAITRKTLENYMQGTAAEPVAEYSL
jgi:CRISPR-associated protein Csm3